MHHLQDTHTHTHVHIHASLIERFSPLFENSLDFRQHLVVDWGTHRFTLQPAHALPTLTVCITSLPLAVLPPTRPSWKGNENGQAEPKPKLSPCRAGHGNRRRSLEADRPRKKQKRRGQGHTKDCYLLPVTLLYWFKLWLHSLL